MLPVRIPAPTRKQITVLFCDVVGYTSRSLALDPEDLAEEIREFQRLCADAAGRHHGHIANFLGDGLLVLFGHPRASEFAAERAVRAGIEMVERIKCNNASLRWRGREPMRIRVGIATGLVVVGERAGAARDQDDLIFGAAPNLAARLQSLAAPNTAVAALRTRRLVGDAFKFRDLGVHRVKGFAQPIKAWRILRERAAPRPNARAAIRLVGRQGELRRLRRHFDRARAGVGRAVLIRGDPGIGKSRLVRAFEKSVRATDVCRLRITCSPHSRGGAHDCSGEFAPIIGAALRWLRIGDGDQPTTKRERLRRAMASIALEGAAEHALFGEMLGIAPRRARRAPRAARARIAEAVATVAVRLSRRAPLLLVAEDLHWADASTLAALVRVVARAGAERLLAVFTARPDFAPPWPAAEASELALGGLDADESAQLIAAASGAAPTAAILRALVRKCGGVPLFLRETSLHRLAPRVAGRGAARARGDDGVGALAAIPDTLQDALNARLDQLGEAKAFAQLAAAFGGEFAYSQARRVAAGNGIDAAAGMDALRAAGLLAARPGGDRYAFRCALLREAAYHSLLRATRRRYQRQIQALPKAAMPTIGQRAQRIVCTASPPSSGVPA